MSLRAPSLANLLKLLADLGDHMQKDAIRVLSQEHKPL